MKTNTCKVCGTSIRLGDFAYNQCVCWSCFAKDLRLIRDMFESSEGKILDHVFQVFADSHGVDWDSKRWPLPKESPDLAVYETFLSHLNVQPRKLFEYKGQKYMFIFDFVGHLILYRLTDQGLEEIINGVFFADLMLYRDNIRMVVSE